METSRVLLDCLAKELIETESAMRVGRMTPEKIKGFIKEFRYISFLHCKLLIYACY